MWYYKNKPYEPTEDELNEYIGFVYIITERDTGKKYIGKKLFWNKRTRPPLKGKKRKRRDIVESDWREYYSSSPQLLESVAKKGPDLYDREIIRLCKTKGECSYYEAKEQFDQDVLLREDFYNGIINCRVSSSHLGL